MAVPNIDKEAIEKALQYIDENGVPDSRASVKYVLVTPDGKKYPPKYVIGVADHLANGGELVNDSYNSVESKNYLTSLGYVIENKQEKYELTIKADSITSTDETFTMDRISDGDSFKPLDVSYISPSGEVIKRKYARLERRNCNQTLPRLALQIFEKDIVNMPVEEKEHFPICQYEPGKDVIRGIYYSKDDAKAHNINPFNTLSYEYDGGRQFVIYSWNIFSTLLFVQECLKRFGEPEAAFKLVYREKDEKEKEIEGNEGGIEETPDEKVFTGYLNPYSEVLVNSKNIIFRGAPGTGKTYLAREIATDIISNGYFDDYTLLTAEQKDQIEFVQFHPSYDYSDFVEGLRPKANADGSMGFELQDGVFKRFVDKARKNFENSQKSEEEIASELSTEQAIRDFFDEIDFEKDQFTTVNGSVFYITEVDEEHVYISIPENNLVKSITLSLGLIRAMLESDIEFKKVLDILKVSGSKYTTQGNSYEFVLYNEIKKRKKASKFTRQEELKKYVFIIDEINRGEISKIFGELFFAVDPGYRGKAGEVCTQYSNLHANPSDKFYIPDNVYIIGTMNDIDRSVDSFDFAMRRRFRFIEIKADDQLEMLTSIGNEEIEAEATARMMALNAEIAKTEGLNENYQIGGSYFLKLKSLSFDQLWTDYLKPLLQEYINGMYDEQGIMDKFAKAYGYKEADGEVEDESN